MASFLTGYLALGTGTTTFTELVATGYSRIPITFSPLVSGQTQSQTGLNFAVPGGWPTVTQFGLFDSSGTALTDPAGTYTGNLLAWFVNPSVSRAGALVVDATAIGLAFGASHDLQSGHSTIFGPGQALGTALVTTGAWSQSPGMVVSVPLIAGVAVQFANGQMGAF